MGPLKRSPFPLSQRSQVWTLVAQTLKTDPVLKQAVDTWQIWSGRDEDTMQPTEENLPLLRMTPSASQESWLDENSQQCRMFWDIDIGVEGTDVTHLFDFWSAVENALFTGNTLLNLLYPLNVIQKTITSAGIQPRMFGEKSGLAGKGQLSILMRINS